MYFQYSFKIASKYPNVVTVVSLCTYIVIYLCLVAFESLRKISVRFKVPHFSLKSLRNGVGRGQNWFIVMKRNIGGSKKRFLELHTYWIVALIVIEAVLTRGQSLSGLNVFWILWFVSKVHWKSITFWAVYLIKMKL